MKKYVRLLCFFLISFIFNRQIYRRFYRRSCFTMYAFFRINLMLLMLQVSDYYCDTVAFYASTCEEFEHLLQRRWCRTKSGDSYLGQKIRCLEGFRREMYNRKFPESLAIFQAFREFFNVVTKLRICHIILGRKKRFFYLGVEEISSLISYKG